MFHSCTCFYSIYVQINTALLCIKDFFPKYYWSFSVLKLMAGLDVYVTRNMRCLGTTGTQWISMEEQFLFPRMLLPVELFWIASQSISLSVLAIHIPIWLKTQKTKTTIKKWEVKALTERERHLCGCVSGSWGWRMVQKNRWWVRSEIISLI